MGSINSMKATGTVAEGLAAWKAKIHRVLESENHQRGWARMMRKCSSLFAESSEFPVSAFFIANCKVLIINKVSLHIAELTLQQP